MANVIKAGIPKGGVEFSFLMLEDYTVVDETGKPGQTYHTGLTYNCYEGRSKFREFALRLIADGKAKFAVRGV